MLKLLKDVETVFVSIVKNDEVLQDNMSLINQLENQSQQNVLLPKITSEDDIYKVGSLAVAKAIHDHTNPFLPYYLNLFP